VANNKRLSRRKREPQLKLQDGKDTSEPFRTTEDLDSSLSSSAWAPGCFMWGIHHVLPCLGFNNMQCWMGKPTRREGYSIGMDE
jgi:hypothetical protein